MGGMVLHGGNIAEMKTGEGKTLVATLPVYFNALTGRGVHVVTVNDYLARRDAEWMGQVYRFLGLSVGCILHDLDDDQRRDNYNCDVTYGTNNEFGFDYLRDNMKMSAEEMVQFGHRPKIQGLQRALATLQTLDDEDKRDPAKTGPLLSELVNRVNRAGQALDRYYGAGNEQMQNSWEEIRTAVGGDFAALEKTSDNPAASIPIAEQIVGRIVDAFRPFALPMTSTSTNRSNTTTRSSTKSIRS